MTRGRSVESCHPCNMCICRNQAFAVGAYAGGRCTSWCVFLPSVRRNGPRLTVWWSDNHDTALGPRQLAGRYSDSPGQRLWRGLLGNKVLHRARTQAASSSEELSSHDAIRRFVPKHRKYGFLHGQRPPTHVVRQGICCAFGGVRSVRFCSTRRVHCL